MKCPHCYCNYDDSERECPMCGTRSSVSACKDSAHKSITYPGTRQRGGTPAASRPVQRSKPAQQRSRPAKQHSPGTHPASPKRPAAAQGSYTRSAEEASRKRRRKKLGWAIAALVLVQFLPALLGLVTEAFSYVGNDLQFRDDGFHFSDSWSADSTPATEPAAAPELETEADGVIPSGTYSCADTGLVFQVDNTELTYQLTLGDFTESGDFFLEYNDPETESEYYTADFPASDYDSYLLAFWHTEDWDEDAVSCTLAIAYFAQEDGPDAFYLDNTYADAPWLPLDRALLLERVDS